MIQDTRQSLLFPLYRNEEFPTVCGGKEHPARGEDSDFKVMSPFTCRSGHNHMIHGLTNAFSLTHQTGKKEGTVPRKRGVLLTAELSQSCPIQGQLTAADFALASHHMMADSISFQCHYRATQLWDIVTGWESSSGGLQSSSRVAQGTCNMKMPSLCYNLLNHLSLS